TAGPAAKLHLHARLLDIYLPGDREVRHPQGRLAGRQAGRALSPLGPGRLRPSAVNIVLVVQIEIRSAMSRTAGGSGVKHPTWSTRPLCRRMLHSAACEVAMREVISFGTWLKRRRKALDLTQEALARLVGL